MGGKRPNPAAFGFHLKQKPGNQWGIGRDFDSLVTMFEADWTGRTPPNTKDKRKNWR